MNPRLTTTQLITAGATVVAAASGIGLLAKELVPSEYEGLAILSALAVTLVVVLVMTLVPYLYRKVMKSPPTSKLVLFSTVIPLAAYFLLGQSWETLVFGAIVSAFVLVVGFRDYDRRQVFPVGGVPTHSEFHWMGVGADQVGMGPDGIHSDGRPDAVFNLNLNHSFEFLKEVTLKQIDIRGRETGQIWTTLQHGSYWPIGVVLRSGERTNPVRADDLHLATEGVESVTLHVSDVPYLTSGWFEPRKQYKIECVYMSHGVEYSKEYFATIP